MHCEFDVNVDYFFLFIAKKANKLAWNNYADIRQ